MVYASEMAASFLQEQKVSKWYKKIMHLIQLVAI